MRLWSKTGLNVATRVTILRIMAIPVFVLILYYYLLSIKLSAPNEYFRVYALIAFCFVALTDALDGYLARSRNEITRLGTILDPLADKALLLSGIIMLTRPSLPTMSPQIPVWLASLVISRDVILVSGAILIHHLAGHVEVRPRVSGKLATTLQMLTIFWVLADGPEGPFYVMAGLAGLFTLYSGLKYMVDGMHQLAPVEEPRV